MIQKRTGGLFVVVYVIYGSIVYTDSKKTVSCLYPKLQASYHLCNFWKVIKYNLWIKGDLWLFHCVVTIEIGLYFINLMYNIIK